MQTTEKMVDLKEILSVRCKDFMFPCLLASDKYLNDQTALSSNMKGRKLY